MSNETDVKPKAEEAAASEAIGQLMAQGKVPEKKEAKAHASTAAADPALHGTPSTIAGKPSRTRLFVLRGLLALNVLAMAALLLVPTGTSAPKPVVEHEPPPQHGEPVAKEPAHGTTERQRRPAYPDKELYTRALQLGFEGKPIEAVAALEQYLSRNPALPKDQKRNIYLQMQYYNTAAGRTKEAEACLANAQQLLDRSFLPEDLLVAAELAAKNGNGPEMRRNYARFLLLQRSLPAALRERVAEACLQLGDSYRLEAEQGEAKAQAEADARQRKLKDGGARVPEKRPTEPKKEHR